MMIKKKWKLIILPLISVVVIIVFFHYISASWKRTKVGILISMTGKYSKVGSHMAGGLEMFKLENPDSDLVLILKDTQGDPAICSKLVEELIKEEHVKVLVGETTSKNTLELVRTAEKYGVPVLIPRPVIYDLEEYDSAFELAPDVYDVSKVVTATLKSLVGKDGRVLIVHDESDDYSRKLAENLDSNLKEIGYSVNLVSDISRWGKDDFNKYSAIVMHRKYSVEMANIVKRILSLGYDGRIIIASAKLELMKEYLGEKMKGIYFIDYRFRYTEKGDRFSKTYFEFFGTKPYLSAVLMYDSLSYIEYLVKEKHGTPLKEAIRNTPYRGIAGYIGNGMDRKSLLIPVICTSKGVKPLDRLGR